MTYHPNLNAKFSNSLETLAAVLAAEDGPRNDPFATEQIVVSGTGLRRWLSLQLAQRRGICANCDFPTTQTFMQMLLQSALGQSEAPRFAKEAMVLGIFDILNSVGKDARLEILSSYLDNQPQLAAMQLAQRIADLFDQYLTYRPDWIAAWEANKSIGNLPASAQRHEEWQRALWQAIRHGTGDHRAALFAELIERLKAGGLATLPETIHVFGTHTLAPVFLRVLEALSFHHRVILYLLQPTPQFWGDHPLKMLAKRPMRLQTATEPTGEPVEYGHPLLAAWGAQGRDLFNLLIDTNISSSEADDVNLFREPAGTTLLPVLQRSLFVVDPELPTTGIMPETDESLRVHCCHHPLREIEVLHDFLLRCFAENKDLLPNDVLVLAPDIEIYAPLIEAVFENRGDNLPRIPYAIADRTLRSLSHAVETFFQIMEICRGRFTVVEVYALFQSPVFRARFQWDDDDLAKVRSWLGDTRTAWGHDGRHRAGFGIPENNAYTWSTSFDRLFHGYAVRMETGCAAPDAMAAYGQDLPQELRPYDAIEGQDSHLLGKLAEAYQILRNAAGAFAGRHQPETWADKIETFILAPLFDSFVDAALDVRQIRTAIASLRDPHHTDAAKFDAKALQAFMEPLIKDGVAGRGFLSRGVTFGSLTPMRAIPQKVVCLIGMHQGSFPQAAKRLTFDLMQIQGMGRTGDRSAHNSGRYLFLETLLSAKEKLFISYCGFSARDDAVIPAAIPVEDLLHFLNLHWPVDSSIPGGKRIKSRFVVEHRLQSHSPEYFRATPHNPLFSYSQSKYSAALALQTAASGATNEDAAPAIAHPAGHSAASPAPSSNVPQTLSIDELIQFFVNPAQFYARNCCGLQIPWQDTELLPDEPLELNKLEEYLIQDLWFQQRSAAITRPLNVDLPTGAWGQWLKDTHTKGAESIFTKAVPRIPDWQLPMRHHLIDCEIDGIKIHGEIDRVHGQTQVYFRPSSEIKPKDLIRAWIRHLLLCRDERIEQTVLANKKLKIQQFKALTPAQATMHMEILLRLLRAGCAAPLPYVLECSYAYAKEMSNPDRAMSDVRSNWEPYDSGGSPPPCQDPWIRLCWPQELPFEPPHTEAFVATALSTFEPLLQHLQ